LFLRVRETPNEAIVNAFKKVFGIDIYSDRAKNIIKNTKISFTDYRNKYNDGVMKYVDEYAGLGYYSYTFLYFY
jgi:hypothetical protein